MATNRRNFLKFLGLVPGVPLANAEIFRPQSTQSFFALLSSAMGWQPACPERVSACLDGIYPPSLTLSIAGLVDADCNCSKANGNWNIPFLGRTRRRHRWGQPARDIAIYQGVFFAPFGGGPDAGPCGKPLHLVCQIWWFCLNGQGVRRRIRVYVQSLESDLPEWYAGWTLEEVGALEPFNCMLLSSKILPSTGPSRGCNQGSSTCAVSVS